MNLIYPPRCPICHDIIAPGCEMICTGCVEKLPLVEGKRCQKCGKPIHPDESYCADCLEYSHEYDQGIGIFLYDDLMRSSISHFKYMGRREYGRFFGMAAWKYGKEMLELWKPEVLVPVPIHSSKKVDRGYNQAEMIARVLGEYMKIPVAADAVLRVEKTTAQKELSQKERRENLKTAFRLSKNPFPWKRVLLIDDIYTTGSTADAVSRVLKDAGVQQIYVLSICIGRGFMVQ